MKRLYKLEGVVDTMVGVTLYVTLLEYLGLIRMADWLTVTMFTVALSSIALYTSEYFRLKKKGKLNETN